MYGYRLALASVLLRAAGVLHGEAVNVLPPLERRAQVGQRVSDERIVDLPAPWGGPHVLVTGAVDVGHRTAPHRSTRSTERPHPQACHSRITVGGDVPQQDRLPGGLEELEAVAERVDGVHAAVAREVGVPRHLLVGAV